MALKYFSFFIACVFSLLSFCNVALAGTAVLNWNAVTTNADGSPIIDLAGYKIYYDTSSHSGTCPSGYASFANAGNVTTYTLNSLPEGHVYYFQLTALDTSNNESACSTSPGEGQKVITYLADFDTNRAVNLFDYNTLITNYGTAQGKSGGDANNDGSVNLMDYNLLITDYGKSF